MLMPASAIENYIRAKDQHLPDLIGEAFDQGAVVQIDANTDAISFPPELAGADRIEQVLVRDFALAWQDVRTFCFSHPGNVLRNDFSCHWMVAMHSRNGDGARLGYGTYDWFFSAESGRVTKLRIEVDQMIKIDEAQAAALIDWAAHLPYPWCGADALVKRQAPNEAVTKILSDLLAGASEAGAGLGKSALS